MTSAKIIERFWEDRNASAHIACPRTLCPAPGQYLLAYDPASSDPLAVPVFSAVETPEGFLAASPLPRGWLPGLELRLRGPLGRGFRLPPTARRVALAAWDVSPACLLGLLSPALAQKASICLVCASSPEDLPTDVEVRPLSTFGEVTQWADYLALAVTRAGWQEHLHNGISLKVPREAQALILASMPCGGLSKCGACSVEIGGKIQLACEDGPVFDI